MNYIWLEYSFSNYTVIYKYSLYSIENSVYNQKSHVPSSYAENGDETYFAEFEIVEIEWENGIRVSLLKSLSFLCLSASRNFMTKQISQRMWTFILKSS